VNVGKTPSSVMGALQATLMLSPDSRTGRAAALFHVADSMIPSISWKLAGPDHE
jgi:hypothetical protein